LKDRKGIHIPTYIKPVPLIPEGSLPAQVVDENWQNRLSKVHLKTVVKKEVVMMVVVVKCNIYQCAYNHTDVIFDGIANIHSVCLWLLHTH